MVNFWKVKKISDYEYHVIESCFEDGPEYVLAKCSGPVPANDIAEAMRLSQTIRSGQDSIHDAIFRIEDVLRILDSEVAAAKRCK